MKELTRKGSFPSFVPLFSTQQQDGPCPVRLSARTQGSHPWKSGSIPLRGASLDTQVIDLGPLMSWVPMTKMDVRSPVGRQQGRYLQHRHQFYAAQFKCKRTTGEMLRERSIAVSQKSRKFACNSFLDEAGDRVGGVGLTWCQIARTASCDQSLPQ